MDKEKPNYTKRVVRGAGLMAVTIGFSSVIAYLIRIVLARNLSTEEFGLFYAVFTLIMFLLVFRDMGLSSALVKFIAEEKAKGDFSKIKTYISSTLFFSLLSSGILVLLLWIFAPFLSVHYFKEPLASPMLRIFSLYVLFSLLTRSARDTLIGFQETRWYSLTEPLREGIAILSALLFFHLGFKVFSPVFGYILGVFLAFFVLFIGASKYLFILKYKITDFWKSTKQLFSFAVPVIFTGFGNKIISYIDVLTLTYFVPLSQVGVYNVVLPTSLMFLIFGSAVSQVLFPMTSELWSKNDKKRLSEGIRMIYTYSFLVTIPLLFGIFAFADVFIGTFFGEQYLAGILAFRILLIGVLCYVVAINNESVISAIGKPLIVTKIVFVGAIINLVLNIIFIPIFNINGAAATTSVSYITILVLSTIKLMRFIEVHPPWKNWLKTFISGFVFVLVAYLLKSILTLNPLLEIGISLAIAGIIYLFAVFLLKITNIQEMKIILKRLF